MIIDNDNAPRKAAVGFGTGSAGSNNQVLCCSFYTNSSKNQRSNNQRLFKLAAPIPKNGQIFRSSCYTLQKQNPKVQLEQCLYWSCKWQASTTMLHLQW